NLAPEQYLQLEGGEAPSDELLRRISMIYGWNFYELQAMLRSEQARSLQPRRLGNPFPGASARAERVRAMLRELDAELAGLPDAKLDVLLTQLELIRGTVAQHQPRQAPAAPDQATPAARRRGHAGAPQRAAALAQRKTPS
ncbi:MAG TPA: hypothetical protein VL359_03490, partial [bacterium]|nr:hypothetical protein [bacterium]